MEFFIDKSMEKSTEKKNHFANTVIQPKFGQLFCLSFLNLIKGPQSGWQTETKLGRTFPIRYQNLKTSRKRLWLCSQLPLDFYSAVPINQSVAPTSGTKQLYMVPYYGI